MTDNALRDRRRTRRSTSIDLLRDARWTDRLLWLTVVTIPFQQAFTVRAGFPLKLVEIFGVLAVLSFVVEYRREILRWRGAIWGAVHARIVLFIAAVVAVSTIVALFRSHPELRQEAYPQGVAIDLLLYFGYAGLALALYVIVSTVSCWGLMIRALRWSVRLAAVYCAVQLLFWSLDVDWLAYVNGHIQVGRLYGISLPRNGPFLEGNYFGFFVVVSTFIVARSRDFVGVALGALMLGYSQSTTAFVALLAGIVFMMILRPTWRSMVILAASALFATLVFFVVPTANRFVMAQLTKLGLVENTLGDAYGYSLRTRTVNTETAISIAKDFPLLGVGQGRYGLYYWDYLDRSGLPSNFGERATRPIANNVYAQIASETGLIALVLFLVLLVIVVMTARKDGQFAVGAAVSASVCLVAFPAWTNLMPWIFLALIIRMVGSARALSTDRTIRTSKPRAPASRTA